MAAHEVPALGTNCAHLRVPAWRETRPSTMVTNHGPRLPRTDMSGYHDNRSLDEVTGQAIQVVEPVRKHDELDPPLIARKSTCDRQAVPLPFAGSNMA